MTEPSPPIDRPKLIFSIDFKLNSKMPYKELKKHLEDEAAKHSMRVALQETKEKLKYTGRIEGKLENIATLRKCVKDNADFKKNVQNFELRYMRKVKKHTIVNKRHHDYENLTPTPDGHYAGTFELNGNIGMAVVEKMAKMQAALLQVKVTLDETATGIRGKVEGDIEQVQQFNKRLQESEEMKKLLQNAQVRFQDLRKMIGDNLPALSGAAVEVKESLHVVEMQFPVEVTSEYLELLQKVEELLKELSLTLEEQKGMIMVKIEGDVRRIKHLLEYLKTTEEYKRLDDALKINKLKRKE